MGPNGVDCPDSINEPVVMSSTDTAKVTCVECLHEMPKKPCERCGGSGYDPEHHVNHPGTGAPEPVGCYDCEGTGIDGGGYLDDNDTF
jgi:hypothetical protein